MPGPIFRAGVDAFERGDYNTALAEFRPLAEQGDPQAQFNLGHMYLIGNGIPQDYQKAAFWTFKAAEQKHVDAMFRVAIWYKFGFPFPAYEKTLVPVNLMKAAEWLHKAAKQGHIEAQYELGMAYQYGNGVAKDDQKAVHWYRKAADQGHHSGSITMGYMYFKGQGVSQNYKEAARWLHIAAERGHSLAYLILGDLYRDGLGVPQNYHEAMKWYRLEADRGGSRAQYQLGVMYAEGGKGVAQDYILAHMWLNLAVAQEELISSKASKARNSLETKMTPDQIAEAQRLAREWKAKRK